ncbi:MAG: hypothetical protein COA79_04595 [Planctomycetota bacterium]|nr:MAG: hypothetical protein COA79_04595 [Planctomycetota bacterium]
MIRKKLHPIVEQFLHSKRTLLEITKDYKGSKEPIVQGMSQLLSALLTHNITLQEKVIQDTENIDLKHVDTNLALLYLKSKISLLSNFNNKYKEKTEFLFIHMKNLINESTPLEIKQIMEFFFSHSRENLYYHYEHYLKHFNLKKTIFSANELRQARSISKIISKQGQLKRIKEPILSILRKEDKLDNEFTDYVERLQLESAKNRLKLIKAHIKRNNNKHTRQAFFKYERWEYILSIFTHEFKPINKTEKLDQEHICFLNANYYLSINEIQKASDELKPFPVKYGFESSNFLSFTNVRLALANKNAPAAQLLLNTKKKYFISYFDDFFQMRIELLQGKKEEALLLFAKLIKNCEYHESNDLFEYELNLSKEISLSDIWFLSNNKSNIKSAELGIPTKYNNKDNPKSIGINRIIHKSSSMKKICQKIKLFANSSLHVLIRGETGVGKDLVAKALHEESPKASKPFIAINCGAISESILQSELFGHEAGAYTSADKKHIGIFESAKDGTVFLDEIGDTSLQIQIALLRVLENLEGRSVGSNRITKYSCRIIAATNADLNQLIKEKKFREDLYFRLKSIEITIPPLRERPKDIEAQAKYFFNLNQIKNNKPILSNQLMQALKKYPFLGNTRELKNEIQNARILNGEKTQYEINDFDFLLKTRITENEYRQPQQILPALPITSELEIVRKPNQTSLRREKVKQLFQKYKRLSRQEITDTLQITYKTAGNDMKALIEEGFIIKVEPTPSPRTHFFILK